MSPHEPAPGGRLLILDDDARVGQTMGLMAESLGLEYRASTDPECFFQLLDEWRPTYIVLDLVMPGMDGVEVMRHLARRQCPATIIISSGVGARVLDAARRAAAEHELSVAGVLPKPFSAGGLEALLRNDTAVNGTSGKAAAGRLPEVRPEWIEQALAAEQIGVVYQPKIACGDGSVVGFEALARWQHPEHGAIPPDWFIPVAEASGLIQPLTARVLETCLNWIAHLPEAPSELTPLTIGVNLSAKNLDDVAFADHLAEQCRERGVEAERVTLELTETAAMEDTVTALDLLTRLRMKGFHIAIDDFGTGYSSMVQLARLPFSELKIDKSFTMAARESEEARTIVRSTIDLGHSLGLDVVAEGVEDAATLALLREMGCDMAQGYHIGRPMGPAQVAQWLALRPRT